MNKSFQFQMCGKLVFDNHAIDELPNHIAGLKGQKPLIVTDDGLIKAGIIEQITGILDENNVVYSIFDEVESDPRIEIVYQCQHQAETEGCDMIIGIGGGSSLDIAKVASVMIANKEDLTSYFGMNNIPGPGIPTIMVPTTSGTGSETTPIAILSDEKEHVKKGVVSDYLYPSIALVDPELTYVLPPYVTAYTGIDALTHAIEAYTNKFAQPFVDTFALEAVRLIGNSLRRAVNRGKDAQARYNMALASVYGGMCLGSVNTAAVHALAYPLGGTFDVPHGVANSLLLPYVMDFNLESNYTKFAHIASALGEETENLNAESAAKIAISSVRKLCSDIGIISRLRDLNIPEDAPEHMAESAMKVTRLLNNNPKRVTLQDARQIYKNAY
jgi:alcohol dehydrogenase class IV